MSHCAACHSEPGGGGQLGPSVVDIQNSRATSVQAVFPSSGERSASYDSGKRSACLDEKKFPLMRRNGKTLFDQFERRFQVKSESYHPWCFNVFSLICCYDAFTAKGD